MKFSTTLLLLCFVSYSLAISSVTLQQCRDLFTSDKEYMKQKYLQEHPKLKDTDVICDSWGCWNTSNCCWDNGYWGDGQWWWVWIIFLLCFGFVFVIFLAVMLIGAGGPIPWYGNGYTCAPGYGPGGVVQNTTIKERKAYIGFDLVKA